MTQFKEEKSKKFAATKTQAQTEKKAKQTLNLLAESEKAKKSIEATMLGFEKQAQKQRSHLRKVEEQLAIAKQNIKALKKELEGNKAEIEKTEQAAYELGKTETEAELQAQLK